MWKEQQLKHSSEKMNEDDRESVTASHSSMCLGTLPRSAVSRKHSGILVSVSFQMQCRIQAVILWRHHSVSFSSCTLYLYRYSNIVVAF